MKVSIFYTFSFWWTANNIKVSFGWFIIKRFLIILRMWNSIDINRMCIIHSTISKDIHHNYYFVPKKKKNWNKTCPHLWKHIHFYCLGFHILFFSHHLFLYGWFTNHFQCQKNLLEIIIDDLRFYKFCYASLMNEHTRKAFKVFKKKSKDFWSWKTRIDW